MGEELYSAQKGKKISKFSGLIRPRDSRPSPAHIRREVGGGLGADMRARAVSQTGAGFRPSVAASREGERGARAVGASWAARDLGRGVGEKASGLRGLLGCGKEWAARGVRGVRLGFFSFFIFFSIFFSKINLFQIKF